VLLAKGRAPTLPRARRAGKIPAPAARAVTLVSPDGVAGVREGRRPDAGAPDGHFGCGGMTTVLMDCTFMPPG
jgi:hypothetical protein